MHAFAQELGALSLSLLVLASSGAQAAGTLFRSYLSVNGSDTNPCTVQLPCRMLPAALAQTADQGEVWMLDSANFNTGAVTISQNVTILAIPGAAGSLVTNIADAIDIPADGITVTLRNLVISNFWGIYNRGVYVSGTNTQLVVEDSEFSGMNEGVSLLASGASAVIRQSVFRNNFVGIAIEGNASMTTGLIDHCTVLGSSGNGILASASTVTVSNSTVTNSNVGVYASDAIVLLEDDQITHNITGVDPSGGIIQTTAGNNIKFNGTNVNGTLTSVSHD